MLVLLGGVVYSELGVEAMALGATAIVALFVPESLARHDELIDGRVVNPLATTSDLSTVP